MIVFTKHGVCIKFDEIEFSSCKQIVSLTLCRILFYGQHIEFVRVLFYLMSILLLFNYKCA